MTALKFSEGAHQSELLCMQRIAPDPRITGLVCADQSLRLIEHSEHISAASLSEKILGAIQRQNSFHCLRADARVYRGNAIQCIGRWLEAALLSEHFGVR